MILMRRNRKIFLYLPKLTLIYFRSHFRQEIDYKFRVVWRDRLFFLLGAFQGNTKGGREQETETAFLSGRMNLERKLLQGTVQDQKIEVY